MERYRIEFFDPDVSDHSVCRVFQASSLKEVLNVLISSFCVDYIYSVIRLGDDAFEDEVLL